MKKSVLRNYARLIARTGANIQKGQEVFISALLDQPDFIRILTEECYRAGASRVVVDWAYEPLTRVHYRYRTLTSLSRYSSWEEARWKYFAETLPVQIHILSDDPDALQGIRPDKLARAGQTRYAAIRSYRDSMENKYQWCIAAVPGKAWARKLFPDLSPAQAVERLWEAILSAARVTEEDPQKTWERHDADLTARCAYLNSLGIESLSYHSSNGTDFRVGLMERSRFCGGADTSLEGISFNPNIPTEECFTSPCRGKAEGIVYATKPLCYQGQLIEDFSIRFHEGRAVEVHARKNQALLEQMIAMDEGASYLGEAALVPYDSPIEASGLLFYNTLFDENAACHLALGAGYADAMEGFEALSLEECRALGLNQSMIHVDFMIGSEDLAIDAHTRDGRTVPIFRKGTWAF